MNFNEQFFLCHHGIIGMKWGIRRYQNKDGSLTPLGYAKYRKSAKKYKNDMVSKYYRDLKKSAKRGDVDSANKANKNLKAFNNMSEKQVISEYARIKNAGKGAGLLLGPIGAGAATAKAIKQAEKDRVKKYVKLYRNLTLNDLYKMGY